MGQATILANSNFATPPRPRSTRSRHKRPSNAEARQSWTLRVLLPNEPVEAPPRIVSTPPLSATVDQPYVYPVVAEDADGNIAGFELTQAPTGMRIDAASGLVSWTPAQPGQVEVTAAVVDATGLRGEQRFVLTVGSVPGVTVRHTPSIRPRLDAISWPPVE
jgi:hypothetical protein